MALSRTAQQKGGLAKAQKYGADGTLAARQAFRASFPSEAAYRRHMRLLSLEAKLKRERAQRALKRP